MARLLREVLGGTPPIERAHRVGRKKTDGSTREIIVKFLRFPDKEHILNSRKQFITRGVTVREDFSNETFALRASFSPKIKEERDMGKIAYVKYRKVVSYHPNKRPQAGGTTASRGATEQSHGIGEFLKQQRASRQQEGTTVVNAAAPGAQVPAGTVSHTVPLQADFSIPPPPLPTQRQHHTQGPASYANVLSASALNAPPFSAPALNTSALSTPASNAPADAALSSSAPSAPADTPSVPSAATAHVQDSTTAASVPEASSAYGPTAQLSSSESSNANHPTLNSPVPTPPMTSAPAAAPSPNIDNEDAGVPISASANDGATRPAPTGVSDSDGPVIGEVEADIHPQSPESARILRSQSAKRPAPPSSESSPSPSKWERRKQKKERKRRHRQNVRGNQDYVTQ